jgi:hypothetical protein
MFLEENTFYLSSEDFLICLSSKPLITFGALCAGVEIQRVEVYGEEYRSRYSCNEIVFDMKVSKNTEGLKVEFDLFYMKDLEDSDCDGICECRVKKLARLYGQQDNGIVRFLEALREDWLKVAYNKCEGRYGCDREEEEDCEKNKHYSCSIGIEVELCDDHPKSVLF